MVMAQSDAVDCARWLTADTYLHQHESFANALPGSFFTFPCWRVCQIREVS
jgi:hypothetical protein